ncbi:MAG: glutamate--cysteine ligase [Thermoleophilia bacterium]
MGREIADERFSDEDHRIFGDRCREGLAVLEALLDRPGFGAGAPSLGAELEVGLVDERAQPAPVNHRVCEVADDERLELELDRFNLELNSRPCPLAGRPFAAIRDDLAAGLRSLDAAAERAGARAVAVGILPTLRAEHLGPPAMSDSPRFRALNAGLRRLRGGPFRIRIDGPEALDTAWDDVTLEGAATGFHIHLRVPPAGFAAALNAAQVALAPALAVGANSPLLLERVLWHETRVALFGQAVDDRATIGSAWLPSRASFGHGWVAGPLEPFAESVALHVPILPVVDEEDPIAAHRAGLDPGLHELRLHHGTVWRWVRAVMAPGRDAHLRIELRALPGGPTLADMMANAAFLVGLTLAVAPEMGWVARSLPFDFARRNFYAAARQGLEAVLLWPAPEAPSPRPWAAVDLVRHLIPVARHGLEAAGVAEDEAEEHLSVIERRAALGATGSSWQRRALAALEGRAGRREALALMTEAYIERAADGAPVHRWSVPTG